MFSKKSKKTITKPPKDNKTKDSKKPKLDKQAPTEKPAKKEAAPEDAPKKVKASKFTEEGYRIYTTDELNIGKGGNTDDCPFDCNCCF